MVQKYKLNFLLLFIIVLLNNFCTNNIALDELDTINRCNENKSIGISCNCINDKIILVDKVGNRKFLKIKGYNGKSAYAPLLIRDSIILIQKEELNQQFLIQYNYVKNIETWRVKINSNLVCHTIINDFIVILGFDSGIYTSLNLKNNSLNEIIDFSENIDFYSGNELIRSKGENIYILSPTLGKKKIININNKKVWESQLNYDFINFIIIDKYIFYIGTNDFHKGEKGLIDINTGEIHYKSACLPNILVDPINKNEKCIYYADNTGNILKFDLRYFNEKVIYKSEKRDSFLGVGSSLLYCYDNNIFFEDNFVIKKIDLSNDKFDVVKEHKNVGFNFIIKIKDEKYIIY